MSGGHWDYIGSQIDDALRLVAEDEDVRRRWPRTATLFAALGPLLRQAEHHMDWDLCGDIRIKDDVAFDAATAAVITGAVLQAARAFIPEENPALYDLVKQITHQHGMPWTDPRTGVTHRPPALALRLRYRQRGGHVHCRLFSARMIPPAETGALAVTRGTFALCGADLVFSLEEWPAVQATLGEMVEFLPEE